MSSLDPRLADFVAHVERCVRRDAPEAFWQAEPALRALLDSGYLAEALDRELAALVREPAYFGGWRPAEWLLHRGPGYALTVARFEQTRRFIHALPFYGLLSPLAGGELRYLRYRLPAAYDNPVFVPGLRLEPDGEHRCLCGDWLALHSDRHAYDFQLPRPVLVLKLATSPIRPLEWLFSRDQLQSWQANDADLSSTQLRVAADVLGKFAHQSSLPALKLLTGHPHHSVRWAAIQSLGRLSRSEAVQQLQQALQDRHPHIRRAAQKTLDQLQKK